MPSRLRRRKHADSQAFPEGVDEPRANLGPMVDEEWGFWLELNLGLALNLGLGVIAFAYTL